MAQAFLRMYFLESGPARLRVLDARKARKGSGQILNQPPQGAADKVGMQSNAAAMTTGVRGAGLASALAQA
ncbi:hypothetical protein ACRAWD_27700 [Caulobacter segnis]